MNLITLSSGLEPRNEVIGTGTEAGKEQVFVKFHYTGWSGYMDETRCRKFGCNHEQDMPLTSFGKSARVVPGRD